MWTKFFAVTIEMNPFWYPGKTDVCPRSSPPGRGTFRERSPAAKNEEKRLLSHATCLAEFLHHVIYLLGFYKKICGIFEEFFKMATMRL